MGGSAPCAGGALFCFHSCAQARPHCACQTRTFARGTPTPCPYVVDSGATLHCINDISLFDSIDHHHPKVKLRVANGKVLEAHAVGTVKLRLVAEDGSATEILLHNVVYHPSFTQNLLSVRRLWRDNRVKTRFGSQNYFKQANTGQKFRFEFNSEFRVQSVMAVSGHKGVSADVTTQQLYTFF